MASAAIVRAINQEKEPCQTRPANPVSPKSENMIVMIARQGDTYHVRVRKSTPLTKEDYIQLQILEHQLSYHGLDPRGAAGSG